MPRTQSELVKVGADVPGTGYQFCECFRVQTGAGVVGFEFFVVG